MGYKPRSMLLTPLLCSLPFSLVSAFPQTTVEFRNKFWYLVTYWQTSRLILPSENTLWSFLTTLRVVEDIFGDNLLIGLP